MESQVNFGSALTNAGEVWKYISLKKTENIATVNEGGVIHVLLGSESETWSRLQEDISDQLMPGCTFPGIYLTFLIFHDNLPSKKKKKSPKCLTMSGLAFCNVCKKEFNFITDVISHSDSQDVYDRRLCPSRPSTTQVLIAS